MGMYINPTGTTKEQWLLENGTPIREPDESIFKSEDILPVCLVDNGPFTAAGICYSRQELRAFTMPDDLREKVWFAVRKDLLEPYM